MPELLANGWTVIAEKPEYRPGQMTGKIVLAVAPDNRGYAVWWRRDEDHATFHGDYYPVIAHGTLDAAYNAAVAGFQAREGYYK